MAGGLPPPPIRAANGDFAWTAWYNQLYSLLSTTGSVSWSLVNKAGSSIADLANHSHNLLTSIQGGTTGQYYHLTSAEHTYVQTAMGGGGGSSTSGFTQIFIEGNDGEEGQVVPGPRGATGITGNTGPSGPPGFGNDGEDGLDGFPVPGPIGAPGVQGATGPSGPAGFGVDGEDGLDSLTPGPIGPQGPQGITGLQGIQGLPGVPAYFIADDSTDDAYNAAIVNTFTGGTVGPLTVNGLLRAAGTGIQTESTGALYFGGATTFGNITGDNAGNVNVIATAGGILQLFANNTRSLSTDATTVGIAKNLVPYSPSGITLGTAAQPWPDTRTTLLNGSIPITTSNIASYVIPAIDGEEGPEGFAIPGPVGPTGASGITGAQGPTGPAIFLEADLIEPDMFLVQGNQGIQGTQGIAGITGGQGPIGPAVYLEAEGLDGDVGPPGPQGIQGIAGPTIYPAAGIANSTGSAWTTSYGVSGTGTTVALTAGPTFTGTLNAATIIATGGGQFGTTSTIGGVTIQGSNTGTGGGATVTVTNGGATVVALGNKSALLGGAYDATPYLFAPSALTIGVATNVTGALAATGNVTGLNLSGSNTGDNAVNTTYASDYRAANFIPGTNYATAPSAGAFFAYGSVDDIDIAGEVTSQRFTGGMVDRLVVNGPITVYGTNITDNSSANAQANFTFRNTNTGALASAALNIQSTGGFGQLIMLPNNFVTSAGLQASDLYLTNSAAASRTVFGINGTVVGSVTSTGLNSMAIGTTTPSTGAFSTLSASGAITASSTINATGAITASGGVAATGSVTATTTMSASLGFLTPPQRFTGTGVTSVTANAGVRWLNLDSSTITSVAITFPASPVDGQQFGLVSFYTVPGITYVAPGTNIGGTVTSISATTPVSWVFQNVTSTWLRC